MIGVNGMNGASVNGFRGLTTSSGAGTSLADVKKSLSRGVSLDNKSVPGKQPLTLLPLLPYLS